jgi:hypothetical protein
MTDLSAQASGQTFPVRNLLAFRAEAGYRERTIFSPIAYGSLQVPWLFRFADRERQGVPFCGYVIGGPRMGWHGLAISRVSGLPLNLPVYMFSDKIKK